MNTNLLIIYNQLIAAGLTKAGALGMLGNWDCESNCESVRVQGDFRASRSESEQYVADIDSGRISREQFQKDQKGFGLAQWTFYSRKGALYDFWKSKGGSIGDVNLQVAFALQELRSDFPSLFIILKSNHDIYQCTREICWKFENPAIKNVDARYASALRIQEEMDRSGGSMEPELESVPTEVSQGSAIESFWPPRTVDKNMAGSDVAVLQALLYARGLYSDKIDGKFGDDLDKAVRRFQSEHGLAIDGVVGPMTWGALLLQS